MTISQKKQLANLKAQARDIIELNNIVEAFDLGKSISSDGAIWIIKAKLDKLYAEIIDKKYGT